MIVDSLIKLFYKYSPLVEVLMQNTEDIQDVVKASEPLQNEAKRLLVTAAPVIARLFGDLRASLQKTSSVKEVDWSKKRVQLALKKLGYDLVVDGDWGPRTRACIADFQTSHGLLADEWPGPKTLLKLSVELIARRRWNETMSAKL